MKATGIVRRMDDLGRVVVPKELRRTMKISEGTPLEIFIDKDGSIIFRKYSPVGELNESAKNMAECISAASGIGTAVCDRDRIIATAGIPKKDLLDKPVSKQLDELMRRKKAFVSSGEDTVLAAEGGLRTANAAFPISCAGDLCGMFLLIKDEDAKPDGELGYAVRKSQLRETDHSLWLPTDPNKGKTRIRRSRGGKRRIGGSAVCGRDSRLA